LTMADERVGRLDLILRRLCRFEISRLKSFIGDKVNFILDTLLNFKPVKRFENRCDVIEFSRSLRNS